MTFHIMNEKLEKKWQKNEKKKDDTFIHCVHPTSEVLRPSRCLDSQTSWGKCNSISFFLDKLVTIFPSMLNFAIFFSIGNFTREVEPSCMEKTSQECPSSLYGFPRWTFNDKFFCRQLPESLGKRGQVAKSHILLWVFFLSEHPRKSSFGKTIWGRRWMLRTWFELEIYYLI